MLLNFDNLHIEKYYNKYRYLFDINNNRDLINFVRNIEIDILTKIKIDKTPQYKIYDQLKIGGVKIITDKIESNEESLILKISGIWETDTDYGITYKFINILDLHRESQSLDIVSDDFIEPLLNEVSLLNEVLLTDT